LKTSPERFHAVHLGRCRSTSDYIKVNFSRLQDNLPLMVSSSAQLGGRGRDGRDWFSAENLGIYATFAFTLAGSRSLSLLAAASGIATADTLRKWTGGEFVLKWPNDILAGGRKVAGILCENMVSGEKVTCLVGIGVNVNHRQEDFPAELRERAGSLRMLTGREWPVAEGCDHLAAGMGAWLRRLRTDPDAIVRQARLLSRPFLDREIVFHCRGETWRGICRGLADDGGLLFEAAGGVRKVFFSGEITDWNPPA
jgi:BirA family biotin operon repressor/biotin-[acetyl-CoA-carboxylase] ligase